MVRRSSCGPIACHVVVGEVLVVNVEIKRDDEVRAPSSTFTLSQLPSCRRGGTEVPRSTKEILLVTEIKASRKVVQ